MQFPSFRIIEIVLLLNSGDWMKITVFLYMSLFFAMVVFVSVSDYLVHFSLNRSLDHAYHRSLMESMGEDLVDTQEIQENFSHLFLQRTPNHLSYKIKLVEFNPAPKVLRIQVRAQYKDSVFVFDETLIEEVVSD